MLSNFFCCNALNNDFESIEKKMKFPMMTQAASI